MRFDAELATFLLARRFSGLVELCLFLPASVQLVTSDLSQYRRNTASTCLTNCRESRHSEEDLGPEVQSNHHQ